MSPFLTPLLLFKLTFVPLMVGGIGWAGTRWNSHIAGLLSGLPVVAGPISWFLYLQYGAAFAVAAAQSTLLGISALAGFCWVYAQGSQRWPWWWSLAAGWSAFLLLVLGLAQLHLNLLASLALTLTSTAVAWRFAPAAPKPPVKIQASTLELVFRMAFALILVLMITSFATRLGSTLSGLLSAFPVATSVVAVFTHRYHAKDQVVASLRGVLLGSLGLSTFYAALAFLPRQFSFSTAFFMATLLVLVSQWLVGRMRRVHV